MTAKPASRLQRVLRCRSGLCLWRLGAASTVIRLEATCFMCALELPVNHRQSEVPAAPVVQSCWLTPVKL